MTSTLVRVRLTTPGLDSAMRQARFGPGGPFALDTGAWAGRTLAEVAAADPEAVHRWTTDTAFAPPGGESVDALLVRAGEWLGALAPGGHAVTADQSFVRAAVTHALGLPARTFWRLDVPPGTLTELTGRSGRWNLRLGTPAPTHEPGG
ncbi:histidine phosphatase family protein [Streptomyces sp. NPDC097619]|uniref:histidine phosphatase family protein n=1 Tax=Streptomyces sp. NPDC097619 TaxID=3157228 RepID=UPI00332C1698